MLFPPSFVALEGATKIPASISEKMDRFERSSADSMQMLSQPEGPGPPFGTCQPVTKVITSPIFEQRTSNVVRRRFSQPLSSLGTKTHRRPNDEKSTTDSVLADLWHVRGFDTADAIDTGLQAFNGQG